MPGRNETSSGPVILAIAVILVLAIVGVIGIATWVF